MHALAQRLSLPSLDSVIDFSPATVASDTSLLDVIALMSQCQSQASYVLIVELSQHQILPTGVEATVQVLGCFTEQDLRILSLGIDFKTATISEVMNILVIGLKQSEIHHISSAPSILRQYNLPSLSVVYEAGKIIVATTDESICQVIEQEVGENAQTEERLRLLELAVDHANDAILIKKGRRQRAAMLKGFITNADCPNRLRDRREQGFKTPTKFSIWWLSFRRGLNPLLNETFSIAAFFNAEADALDEPLGSRIVYVNKAFILMIGRLVSEIVGETWGILHGEKTSHSQLERICAALQSGLSISTSN